MREGGREGGGCEDIINVELNRTISVLWVWCGEVSRHH